MNECPIPSVQPRFYICLRYSFILNNKMMVLIVKMVTKSRIYTNEIKCKWCTAYKIEHNKWNISFQFIQCPFALCCSIIIYENVCQRRQPITFKLKEVCSMSFFWCLLCCCCCCVPSWDIEGKDLDSKFQTTGKRKNHAWAFKCKQT